MNCGPGDWIETPSAIVVVVMQLADDLVVVYDLESHERHVVATQHGCCVLACCHPCEWHDKLEGQAA